VHGAAGGRVAEQVGDVDAQRRVVGRHVARGGKEDLRPGVAPQDAKPGQDTRRPDFQNL
jgi:hypothetical protein